MVGLRFFFFLGLICLIETTTIALGLPSGRFHRSQHQHHGSLENGLTCDRCLPGWGLVSLCNRTHTSVCKPCPPRTWSPHHPHLQGCRACSRCGRGLYVDRQCSSTHDTACGWCSGTKGRFNIDFIKKCLMRHDVPKNQQSAALRLFFQEEKKRQWVAGHRSFDSDSHHRLWSSESGEKQQETILLKPSYHAYDIERMVHAHRRKVFILVGLTAVIFLTTVIFGACFLFQYCSGAREGQKQQQGYRTSNQKLYVQLTDEQQSMIRQSAKRLELVVASHKERAEEVPGEVASQDDYWEENPFKITENPLEKLLPSFDAQSEGYCNQEFSEEAENLHSSAAEK